MRAFAISLFSLFCCCSVLCDVRSRPRSRPTGPRGRNDTALQTNLLESPCKGKPLDFVLVIDSSRSVRPHDYEKVKTFITNILRFLDVGPDATRVGLLQYGSVVQNEFSLKTFHRKADMERAVRDMVHLASGTMTGLALQYTMNVAFSEAEGARPLHQHIPRIAMVVTDGRPQDTVKEAAARARQAGIQIFAIGVGRVDMSTLRAIGSEPHSEHVYLVANFSQIQTLTSVFQSKLCGGANLCSVINHRCEHICVSTPTSYVCRCRKGYVLNPDGKTCRGIDQCALGTHGCEHECVNTGDSFVCRCHKGYRLNPDGKTCKKIDQCALGTHGCEHKCVNTGDSFVCRCHRGYTLNPDGKTCKKIDQCALGAHGCEHECVNTEDSFVCRCRKGYTLNPDGKTCKSIDVCSTVSHGCEHLCVSTPDSYICKCREGYTLAEDRKSCKKLECRDGALDLVFVIDGSKSLGPANFQLVKQFVIGIVDALDVSPTATRVGLLQYSTKVRAEFTLGQLSSGEDVREAVSRVQYMGRGSMTGSALRHMFEFSFSAKEGARPDARRICIVFTDGRSQDDVSKWSTKAQESGITVYAVGVGKAIEEELREIASAPDDKHLFYAEDFSLMGQITDKLKSRICKEKPSNEDLCKCEHMVSFQSQATEQLRMLSQRLEAVTKRLEMLENRLGHN
ncbi:matrilin-2-like isoform X1 [Anguilla rostrata]|uniref:matrilin-2-like isoform X1 n=1 Tax=Anguilla rostrata TaxID=7938 RepID=UPI0030CEB3BB